MNHSNLYTQTDHTTGNLTHSIVHTQAITATLENTRLSAKQLCYPTDSSHLPSSSKRIKANHSAQFLGQQRAQTAIETGINLPYKGYNICAVGISGLGKRSMIMRLLQQHAKQLATPSDWVYVNHFKESRKPLALALNAGGAVKFQTAMHDMWLAVITQLQRRFNADSYQQHVESIRERIEQNQQHALLALTQEGASYALKLMIKDEEHYFVAIHPEYPEQILSQQDMAALDRETRLTLTTHLKLMNKKLKQLSDTLNNMEDVAQEQVKQLNQHITKQVLEPKIKHILQRFEYVEGLTGYLTSYQEDIIQHIELILNKEDDDFKPTSFHRVPTRYQVNVMASYKPNQGAPVIFEDFPTHYNLLGHVEQLTHMGTISTDFTLIRAGSLHRANGGFLILEAEQLLEYAYAWQGLKRALKLGTLKLSSLEHLLTLTGSISIEPQAIPLQVKIILLAEPETYYELLEYEPDLGNVFKIRADFSDTLIRNAENEYAYLQLVNDYIQQDKLLAFDRSALAAILNHASRQAEDQNALSLHAATLGDLLRESHHHAVKQRQDKVSQSHIQQVLQQRQYRLGYLRELYWQDISKGTQLIETQGQRLGQINALSVIHYADAEFGLPSRLTASVYHGGGDILDIERSVELGGALHAKGVLLMSSFLKAHFGRTQALHFSAALAFEQSYAEVDGDSATVAELCALISAISQIPIHQSWGITGSMNQLGQVQPVGGVNAKIEGFFAACQLQGLTGQQGVIVPRQNMQHLMLHQDVIDAVRAGQFHIHAIDNIEQALELVMNRFVGTLNKKGCYPEHSIFAAVMAQLEAWQAVEDGILLEQKSKKNTSKSKKRKKKGINEAIKTVEDDSTTKSEPAHQV